MKSPIGHIQHADVIQNQQTKNAYAQTIQLMETRFFSDGILLHWASPFDIDVAILGKDCVANPAQVMD